MTSQLGPAPASFTFEEQRILNAETLEKKELFLFQWLSSLEKDLLKSNRVLFVTHSQGHYQTLSIRFGKKSIKDTQSNGSATQSAHSSNCSALFCHYLPKWRCAISL